VLDLRALTLPIVGAPMAGGPSTPALAAAVSSAGGLGFLAAGYRSAKAVADDIAAVRRETSAPFGVNLFVVPRFEPDAAALAAYRRALESEAARLDVELGVARWDDDDWQAKLEVMYDERPDVVSFTFGCPDNDVLRQLSASGIVSVVTVTTLIEARVAVDRGAAALSIQGSDGGGHRGTWDQLATPDTTPLPELVREIAGVVEAPLFAGGGIHDWQGVQALLEVGAVAAQIGTAFLLCDEAGTNPTHRAALTGSPTRNTRLTRAYTGRWARGLENRFMLEHPDAPAGYPHVHHLTAPLRAAAIACGDQDVAHLWAGRAHARTRAGSAAQLTGDLAPAVR